MPYDRVTRRECFDLGDVEVLQQTEGELVDAFLEGDVFLDRLFEAFLTVEEMRGFNGGRFKGSCDECRLCHEWSVSVNTDT